jgi:hypothetical protein
MTRIHSGTTRYLAKIEAELKTLGYTITSRKTWADGKQTWVFTR